MAWPDRDLRAALAGLPAGGVPANLLHRLAAQFVAERERWPLWLPVFLGIGIGAYFWLAAEPAPALGASLLAASAAFVAFAWRQQRDATLALILFAIALGFAAAQLQATLAAAPVLERRLGPVMVEGRLVAVDPLPEGARLVIAPSSIERLALSDLPARVRIRLRHGDTAALPGAWLRVRAVLMPPPAPVMPGAYDFERRAFFDRLGAVGFALGGAVFIDPPAGEGASAWRTALQALRTAVSQRIHAALPGRDGTIAAALIVGDTHAIPPEDAGAFRDAGLAHILVIAGLHMGMVAGLVFFALRALLALIPVLVLNHPTKKWAAGGALAVTFGYMLLSGATVSSRRAFVMIALALLAVLVDRFNVSARAVAAAAVVIMLMTPEAATGPSFQMSFAAVAALIACYEALRPSLSAWHLHAGPLRRFALYLFGIALTTVVTTVATMPFTIYHFNRFPIYSVVANALAVPITGFWVMPWAIGSCVLMPFHLESLALAPMSWGIGAISGIAHWVTRWPGAVLHVASMPVGGLMLIALGGVWLCIWLGRWRWLGLAAIGLGYLSLVLVRPPDLLVSGDTRFVAVRAPDGNYLPSATQNRAAESWTRRAAVAEGAPWPADGSAADGALSCDASACLYRARGRLVALIRQGDALDEDCGHVALVVSPFAAHRTCRKTLVIDRIDTWRKGGYAVWLDPGGIRIEAVRDWQGARPWVPRPGEASSVSSAASGRPGGLAP
jgi:competence protein ComEC